MEGQCAFCGLSNQVRICKNPDTGKGPQFCSTLLYPECIEKAAEEYQSEEIHTFAVNSAKNERSCYDCSVETAGLPKPVKCRIEETIDPEQAIDRALETYLKKGYSEEWVHQRRPSQRGGRGSEDFSGARAGDRLRHV